MAAKKQHAVYNLIQPYTESITGRYGDITKDAIYKNCWFVKDAHGDIYLEKRPSINTSVLSTQGQAFGMGKISTLMNPYRVPTISNEVGSYLRRVSARLISATTTSQTQHIKVFILSNSGGTSQTLYRTGDYLSWTEIDIGTTNTKFGIAHSSTAWSTPKLIVVGNNFIRTCDYVVADTVDGDTSWTARTVPASHSAPLYYDVKSGNGTNRVIAVGGDGGTGVVAYTDDGVTWTAGTITGTPGNLTAVYGVSATRWLAGTSSGQIWVSTDNGVNWAACTTQPTGLSQIYSLTAYNAFGGNGFAASSDSGDNWTNCTGETAQPCYHPVVAGISVYIPSYAVMNYATQASTTFSTYTFDITGTPYGMLYDQRYGFYVIFGDYITIFYPTTTAADAQSLSLAPVGGVSFAGTYTADDAHTKDYIMFVREQYIYVYNNDLSTSIISTNIGGSRPFGGKASFTVSREASGRTFGVVLIPSAHNVSYGVLYLYHPGAVSLTLVYLQDTYYYIGYNLNKVAALARGVVAMDGYIFFMTVEGRIYNTKLGDPDTVVSTEYITANRYEGLKSYITKHNNLIIVLGTSGIEFFYNTGNPLGSPLTRRDDLFYPVGCTAWNTACTIGTITFFVGNLNTGGNLGVYMIDGYKLSEISVPALTQYLTTNISQSWDIQTLRDSMFAEVLEKDGHIIYVLTVVNSSAAAKTFVYDYNTKSWFEWYIQDRAGALTTSGGKLGTEWVNSTCDMLDIIGSATAQDTYPYVQFSTGEIYKWPKGTYTSDLGSTAIEMVMQTSNYDYGTIQRKFFNAMYFRADKVGSSNNLSVQYSDDDGTTWSTARTVDLNAYYPVLTRWGQARRRQWKFTHTATTAVRLQAIELEVEGVGNEFQPKRRTSASE